MIDRSLNYGRHQIARFLQNNRSVWVLITAKPTSRVLDLGAGHGTDLTTARRVLPESQLIAVESWPPYVEELKSLSVGICAPHRARCLTLRGWIGRYCHRQSNTGTYQRVFLDIPSGLQGVACRRSVHRRRAQSGFVAQSNSSRVRTAAVIAEVSICACARIHKGRPAPFRAELFPKWLRVRPFRWWQFLSVPAVPGKATRSHVPKPGVGHLPFSAEEDPGP